MRVVSLLVFALCCAVGVKGLQGKALKVVSGCGESKCAATPESVCESLLGSESSLSQPAFSENEEATWRRIRESPLAWTHAMVLMKETPDKPKRVCSHIVKPGKDTTFCEPGSAGFLKSHLSRTYRHCSECTDVLSRIKAPATCSACDPTECPESYALCLRIEDELRKKKIKKDQCVKLFSRKDPKFVSQMFLRHDLLRLSGHCETVEAYYTKHASANKFWHMLLGKETPTETKERLRLDPESMSKSIREKYPTGVDDLMLSPSVISELQEKVPEVAKKFKVLPDIMLAIDLNYRIHAGNDVKGFVAAKHVGELIDTLWARQSQYLDSVTELHSFCTAVQQDLLGIQSIRSFEGGFPRQLTEVKNRILKFSTAASEYQAVDGDLEADINWSENARWFKKMFQLVESFISIEDLRRSSWAFMHNIRENVMVKARGLLEELTPIGNEGHILRKETDQPETEGSFFSLKWFKDDPVLVNIRDRVPVIAADFKTLEEYLQGAVSSVKKVETLQAQTEDAELSSVCPEDLEVSARSSREGIEGIRCWEAIKPPESIQGDGSALRGLGLASSVMLDRLRVIKSLHPGKNDDLLLPMQSVLHKMEEGVAEYHAKAVNAMVVFEEGCSTLSDEIKDAIDTGKEATDLFRQWAKEVTGEEGLDSQEEMVETIAATQKELKGVVEQLEGKVKKFSDRADNFLTGFDERGREFTGDDDDWLQALSQLDFEAERLSQILSAWPDDVKSSFLPEGVGEDQKAKNEVETEMPELRETVSNLINDFASLGWFN